MNVVKQLIYLSVFILIFPQLACSAWNKPAKLTVRVIDNNHVPIKGATVGIGFEVNKVSGWGMQRIPKKGLTDEKGLFSATAIASNYVGYTAWKNGEYYRTYAAPIIFNENSIGRWEPWNPLVELVLRKIENPVPMYVKKVELKIPVYEKPLGFDLVAGDWVVPFGNGTTKDFSFTINKQVNDAKNHRYTLLLQFSTKGDGIQPVEWPEQYGSTYKLPRYAPEDGYQSKLAEKVSNGIFGDKDDRNSHFFYRVRTVLDKNGYVTKALYGKIPGGIEVQYLNYEDAQLAFIYYLNPDKTRNMEFDPTKNLFPTDRFNRVLSP